MNLTFIQNQFLTEYENFVEDLENIIQRIHSKKIQNSLYLIYLRFRRRSWRQNVY